MRQICQKLRYAFVALLTTALLVGPCLSFVGAFGLSPAHAHASMNHVLPHDMSFGHDHSHHSAGHVGHKIHGEAPGTSHYPTPLSCEELCEGWALKKAQRIWATAVDSDADDAPPHPQLRMVKIDLSPQLQLTGRQPELVRWTGLPAFSPTYELTGRYRL